jgi:hypothetical protein
VSALVDRQLDAETAERALGHVLPGPLGGLGVELPVDQRAHRGSEVPVEQPQ